MNTTTNKGRIVIDREKCTGCGQCVNACHAGALAMADGKACLVDENHCDGLGACIGECPFGAISFTEQKTGPADADMRQTPVHALPIYSPPLSHAPLSSDASVHTPRPAADKDEPLPCGCPGHMNQVFSTRRVPAPAPAPSKVSACGCPGDSVSARAKSELGAWPIQLHLIRPTSAQFQGSDLLVAASCSAFSHAAFHEEMLRDKALVIACPKLDRQDGYMEKLTELFRDASPASVTVVRMEVPCCQGLTQLVRRARMLAQSKISIKEMTIGLQGGVVKEHVYDDLS